MADAALRLAVLFGPRRGVTREVHQRLLVGRAAEADLQLLDDKVSREHCVFEATGRELVLRDLGSRNGTWVNGARLEAPRVLAANDTIGIGETVVVYAADVAASLARDGDSTLVVGAASPLTAPVLADEPLAEPAAEALNQAGRLMLEAALAPSRDEAALALAREARALSAIDHPGVVKLHREGEERSFSWYAMERVEGEDLRERLKRGPLPTAEVLALARAVLEALTVVHAAGIVHRDVKPSNILLSPSGPKLCDFGIARVDRATTLTESAALLGSLRYMAPEQRWGQSDGRSDLYALGVVLHEALALGVPGERPLPPGVPESLVRFIGGLTETSPERRPPTAAAARRALEARSQAPRRLVGAPPLDRTRVAHCATARDLLSPWPEAHHGQEQHDDDAQVEAVEARAGEGRAGRVEGQRLAAGHLRRPARRAA